MSTLYIDDVRRGVDLLDAEVPTWRDKIDPSRLHLTNCKECVLGQVFGSYEAGLNALGLTWDAADYGFSLESESPQQWAWLTRTWHMVLGRV